MVGFRRIKTKWLVTAAMVLAVALGFGIWLHHRAAVAAAIEVEAAKEKTADAATAAMSKQLVSPYATAADFAKYAMKLREQGLLKVEPQVFEPTSSRPAIQRYPWKTNIVTTVFWIGEKANYRSVWDSNWTNNY